MKYFTTLLVFALATTFAVAQTSSITTFRNGKTTEIKKKDGRIVEMKIDGEVIPEEDYHLYENATTPLILKEGGSTIELNFDNIEESAESFADRMERWGEELGESFENLFDFRYEKKGNDGGRSKYKNEEILSEEELIERDLERMLEEVEQKDQRRLEVKKASLERMKEEVRRLEAEIAEMEKTKPKQD